MKREGKEEVSGGLCVCVSARAHACARREGGEERKRREKRFLPPKETRSGDPSVICTH